MKIKMIVSVLVPILADPAIFFKSSIPGLVRFQSRVVVDLIYAVYAVFSLKVNF